MVLAASNQHTSISPSGAFFIYNKAFFGKTTCLKITLNSQGDVYFHFGLDLSGKWVWKKVKFNDSELGDMINVLSGKTKSKAFFHVFNDDKTQIWVTGNGNCVTFKTKHASRTIYDGELVVLEIILRDCIVKMNVV